MKIVTAGTGKKTLKLSKSEWIAIGKRAGWTKVADDGYENSEGSFNDAKYQGQGGDNLPPPGYPNEKRDAHKPQNAPTIIETLEAAKKMIFSTNSYLIASGISLEKYKVAIEALNDLINSIPVSENWRMGSE